jgi:hypothetical protein
MKKLFILLFLFQICFIYSLTFQHLPPASFYENEKAVIQLEIRSGFNHIKQVEFLYRKTGEINFSGKDMVAGSESDPFYTCTLKDLSVYGNGIEYYFLITDIDDNVFTYPEISPQTNSFRFGIISTKRIEPGFILLSPDQNVPSETPDFTIAISLFSVQNDLKENSLKFFFDGKDRTSAARITTNMLIYQIQETAPGKHTFQVTAELKNGEKINSRLWSHQVPGKIKTTEFNYSGDITAASRIRRTNSESEDTKDENHSLLMNLRGNYKKLDMRSRIYLSSREDSDDQAVNRYNIKLKIPHLEFIGGDHSPYFGIFSANGKNLRGIHTNVLFRNFRFYFSFGKIYRSVNGKADTTYAGQNYTTYSGSTFKRNSLALRTEVGTRELLQWGLSFSKTKDEEASLKKKYYITQTDSMPSITPKDNIVLASDLRLALNNQRLVMGLEWAMSMYNDNIIGGAVDKDSLESDLGEELPFDPESLEHIFVINKNVSPIIPNLSSMAYNLYLKWMMKNNLFSLSYSAIGASFNSLAANFLTKDTSILSIYDNLNLMRNRLILSLGVNLYSDNVYDEKEFTFNSSNIFTQIMYRPLGLPYFSLMFTSNSSGNDQENAADEEALQELDLSSNTINFNTGYYVNNITFAPTLFTFAFSNNLYKDEAEGSFEYQRNSFSLSASSDFSKLPVKTLITYTFAVKKDIIETYETSQPDTDNFESSYNSIYLRANFSFQEDKYKPYADLRLSAESGDQKQNSTMANIGITANISKDMILKSSLGMANYSNEDQENEEYSRLNFRINLKYKF